MKFSKYQGAGNDFIIINDREKHNFSCDDIVGLCDRRFGVGADGLILIQSSEKAAFAMDFYNNDGSSASFCGNGGRCVASFAFREKIVDDSKFIFEANDGLHSAEVTTDDDGSDWVKLSMRDVDIFTFDGKELVVNTGVPHCVIIVDDVEKIDLMKEGRATRFASRFAPDGVNVDFLDFRDNEAHLRTYERGVEGETLACGTGVTAAAIATSLVKNLSDIKIKTRVCTLNVQLTRDDQKFKNIFLSGPATEVFKGFTNFV